MSEFVQNVMASLLLEKFASEEIRRLEQKARWMKYGQFGEREKASDEFWRKQNSELLETAKGALSAPQYPQTT